MNDTDTTTKRDEFLTDVLITAVEGGIGYWSVASNYRVTGPVAERGVTLYELNEWGGAEGEGTRLTLNDVSRGIRTLLEPGFRVADYIAAIVANADRLSDCCPEGSGDVDAEVADCIVQAAMFGEVRYG